MYYLIQKATKLSQINHTYDGSSQTFELNFTYEGKKSTSKSL